MKCARKKIRIGVRPEKGHYLVIQRIFSKKEIYANDFFCFKDNSGNYFYEQIEAIDDSTFQINSYQKNSDHFESYSFKTSEIKYYYRHPLHKINWKVPALDFLVFGPFVYNWANFKISPWQNKTRLLNVPILYIGVAVYAGGVLIRNRDLLFNRIKLHYKY